MKNATLGLSSKGDVSAESSEAFSDDSNDCASGGLCQASDVRWDAKLLGS